MKSRFTRAEDAGVKVQVQRLSEVQRYSSSSRGGYASDCSTEVMRFCRGACAGCRGRARARARGRGRDAGGRCRGARCKCE